MQVLPYAHHQAVGTRLYDVDVDGNFVDITPPSIGAVSYGNEESYSPWSQSGQSYDHYSVSSYDYTSSWFGPFYSSGWEGHELSVDVWQSWGPSYNSMTVRLETTDWWGQSFGGPGYNVTIGHSEQHMQLDVLSASFGPWGASFFEEHQESQDVLDFSNFQFGGTSINDQHSSHFDSLEMHSADPWSQTDIWAQNFAEHDSHVEFGQGYGSIETHDLAISQSHQVSIYDDGFFGKG